MLESVTPFVRIIHYDHVHTLFALFCSVFAHFSFVV